MTVPGASSDTARGCWTRRGCCRPARRTTRPVWRGWWPRRCRPLVRSRSVGRCCWAARPGCPRWWCTSNPWGSRQPDYGARHVAALVLIVEPGHHPRLDPDVVARTLGLTPAESQVAVWVAGGKNVRDIATDDGTHGRRHLLAPEADLPETADLPAGGSGAVGAVDRRVRVTAARPASSLAGLVLCSSPTPKYFLETTNPVSDWIAL